VGRGAFPPGLRRELISFLMNLNSVDGEVGAHQSNRVEGRELIDSEIWSTVSKAHQSNR
jgi:hypothetical protein